MDPQSAELYRRNYCCPPTLFLDPSKTIVDVAGDPFGEHFGKDWQGKCFTQLYDSGNSYPF